MIRLTWLQSRAQNVVAVSGLAIVAVALAVTGPHLASLYNSNVANCAAHGDCGLAKDVFLRHDSTLRAWLDALVVVVPGLVGIFWGAPLVAREFESGTHRLIWTQSVSRARWLGVKLGTLGIASIAVAGLLSLMVTWWASPLDRTHMSQFSTFDERDLVPIGYAAFAFALAVAAGTVIRRTIPAITGALFAFVGARLAVWHWVRPHLAAAIHRDLPMSAAHHFGFVSSPAGAVFVAGDPSIDNAWILSNRIVDKAGNSATAQGLHRFVQAHCPSIADRLSTSPGHGGPPAQGAFEHCLGAISAKFGLAVTYQPHNHYWPLQWYEAAIFILAALALAAFSFWWVRRRHL